MLGDLEHSKRRCDFCYFRRINVEEVKDYIRRMHRNKAAGEWDFDEIFEEHGRGKYKVVDQGI